SREPESHALGGPVACFAPSALAASWGHLMSLNPLRAARIGNLRDRVTLQQQGIGGDWQDRGRIYARVEPLRGDERWSSALSTLYAEQSFAVHVRYRDDVAPAGWRVLWERDAGQQRKVLDVKGVSNPDERRRFL